MPDLPLTIPGFTDTVSVNLSDLADAIRADLELYDRSTNIAAFAAIRNGVRLMWVRDQGQRGDLTRFVKSISKRNQCERTLYRHLAAAEQFAKDAGLLEKKTQKLTNGDKVAPILAVQLELFADPKAKFEGALKKLVKWVGERGLADLYKQTVAAKTTRSVKLATLPPIQKTHADLCEEGEEEIIATLNALDAWFLAEHHVRVKPATRDAARHALEGYAAKLKEVQP